MRNLINFRIEAIAVTLLLFILAAFLLGPESQVKPDRRQFGGIQIFVADVAGEQPRVRVVQGRVIDQQDSTVLSKRTGKKQVVGTSYWLVPDQTKSRRGRTKKP